MANRVLMRRVVVLRAVALALSLCSAALLGECAVRLIQPSVPVQRVRGRGLHLERGVPIWGEQLDRRHEECVEQHPERTRIMFFGSSITFGSELRAEQVFTTLLEDSLNRSHPVPGFCVLNFAQPGFVFQQKLAVAQTELPRYRPALVLWEDWVEWRDYRMIGDTAYGAAHLRVRGDGSFGIAGVPDAANRWLFIHSRLYEALTLTGLGQSAPQPPEHLEVAPFVEERLSQVPTLVASTGSRLVMYLATPLDRAFAQLVRTPPAWQRFFEDFAAQRAIPVYALQRELVGQDYLELRNDPCCHFNAAGHRVLAAIMARIVLRHLDEPKDP